MIGDARGNQHDCRIWFTEMRHNEDKTKRGRVRYEQSQRTQHKAGWASQ